MITEKKVREILVCADCERVSVGTAYQNQVPAAIDRFSRIGQHIGHNIQVEPNHPQDPLYGKILDASPDGIIMYGDIDTFEILVRIIRV